MFAFCCTLSLSALVICGQALTHIVLSSIEVSCIAIPSNWFPNSNAAGFITGLGISYTAFGDTVFHNQGTGIYTGCSNAFFSTSTFSAVTISGSYKYLAHNAVSFALIRFRLLNTCICFCLSSNKSNANDTPYGSQGNGLYRLMFTP